MAGSTAELQVNARSNVGDALSGLNTLNDRMADLSRSASVSSAGVLSAFSGIGAGAVAMGNLVASGVQAAASAILGAGQAAVGTVASFEKMSAQMASMAAVELVNLGQFKDVDAAYDTASEKAKQLLEWSQQLAIISPFSQEDVSSAMSMAQAFGFLATQYQTTAEAQKAGVITAQRLTEATMNWAAATGKAGHDISRVVTIAGQIQSLGKLMGGDSMQLKQVGINLEGALAKMKGTSVDAIMDMREKGLIPAKDAMQALMQEMEKFGSSASKQADTIGGLMASLGDLKDVSMRNAFTGILTAIKPVMSSVVSALSDPAVQQAIQNLGNTIGQGVSTAIGFLQSFAAQAQTALAAFRAGLETGGAAGGVQALLAALGLSGDLASVVGGVLTNVVAAVQTGVGAIRAAIQGFQQAGATGAAFNFLTALGIDPTAVATLIATVQTVIAAVQGAFATLKAAIQSAQQGLVAGPGVAAINFLSALGLDPTIAAQIGVTIANIATALQTGIATLRSILAAFQTGGLAGGANAIAQALGLDPALVGQIAAVLGQVGAALQAGIGFVVGVVVGAASLIVQNWQTVVGVLAGIGAAVAGFMAFQAVVGVVTAVAGALAFLLSPVALVIAAGALIGAAWVNNWGNIQGVVAQAVPILQAAAMVIGGVLVTAVVAAGAVVGWLAQNWGTIAGIASTLAGIVGGALAVAFNVLAGVIGFVVQHWQVFAAALGVVAGALAGGAIFSGVMTIIGAFTTFISIIQGVGIAIGGLSGIFATITAVLALPAAPLILLGALVAGLAVAWVTNLGNIQGNTNTYLAQIQASWEQLLGFIRAIVAFFQTPIDFSNPIASAQAVGQAWGKLKSDLGEVESEFQARLAGIAQHAADGGNAVASSAGQTADVVRDQYYRMPEDASVATQLMKAATEGNFAAIPGIVGGNMEVVKQVLGEKVAHMVEIVSAGAAKIKSELAAMQAAGQYVSEADMGAFADTGSMAQSAAIKAAPPSWSTPAFKPPDFSKVTSGLGTAGKGASGATAAAKSAEDKIKEANQAIQSTIETVNKLNEMLKSGLDGLTVGEGADKLVVLAGQIAALGRRFADAFAKAATGLSEDAYKGAQALGQGISAATGAINAMVGMLPKLMEFLQSDAWAEISAAPGAVVAAASQIIQLGKAISDAFTAAMGNVSDETAKSAQNGAAVVGAAAQAMNALVGMLPKLWEFINDPAFSEIMAAQGEVVNAASQIIQLGKAISDAFLGAMGSVSDETAKAAQNGAAVIGAATQSISSIIDTVKKIVDFTADAGYAAALFSDEGRANILHAADLLIGLGVDMFNMFSAAAAGISTKAAASAKRLGEGLQSMGQGITAVVDVIVKMGSWLQDGMNAVFSTSPRMQADLVALATLMSDLGAAMLVQFGGAGAKISSLTVAAAKRLSEGIQAATGGITAVVDIIVKFGNFIQDGMNAVFTVTPQMQRDLIALSTLMATLARGIYEQWLAAAATVSQYHVEAAKRLAEGIKAAADGITATIGVVTAMLHLMGDSAQAAAVKTGEGRMAMIALAHSLSTLARDVYDTWVTSAASTSQYHVEAAKRLSEGIKAAADGITAALAVVTAFIEASASKAVTAATTTFVGQKALIAFADTLSRIARDIYDTWVTAAASVSQYHVDAAKRLSEGIQAAASAITATRDLVVLAVQGMSEKWPTLDTGRILTFISSLVVLGTKIATAAAEAMGEWSTTAIPALTALGTVLQAALNAIESVFKIAEAVAVGNMGSVTGSDFVTWTGGGYSVVQQRISWLVLVGQQMVTAANAAMGEWSTPVLTSLQDLGTVLQRALSVIESVFKIAEAVTAGNMKSVTGGDFVTWTGGGYSVVQQRISWLVLVGQQMVTAANAAMGEWSISVNPELADLGVVLQDSLSVIQDVLGIVENLMGEKYPNLSGGALTAIKDRLAEVLNAGKAIADKAIEVATGWQIEVNPVMTDVGTVLGQGLEIISKTLDIVGQLGGEKFPPLTGAALETIKTRLTDVLNAGKAIADKAIEVATEWTMTVNPVLTRVGTVLGQGLEIVSKTLDIVGQLGGEKFPPLTGAALETIKTRLTDVLTAGKAIADKANEVATGWTMMVNPVMTTVGTVLGQGLEIVSKTLDIVGQLGGDKFPPLTGAALETIKTRLTDVLTAGKAIADKALEVALGWTMTVNPVMVAVGTVLGQGLEIVSKTLDIVGQLGGEKFPPLTGDALARILTRLEDVLAAGKALANAAVNVAREWAMTVNPVMVAVGTVLGQGLEIVSKTLDIVGQLGGEKFPSLTGDALARILVRFEDVLAAGKALANRAIAIAKDWTMTVNPVMVAVGTVLGQGLEIVSKTLDIVGQLGGEKFPPLTGDALARILVRFEDVLAAGKALANRAIAIAKDWMMTVNPVMVAVGTVLGQGLEIVSKTLDIVGQLSGDKFPAVTGDALTTLVTRFEEVLKAGKALADKAVSVATGWTMTVNPAMTAVGTVLAASLDIISKTLDIVGQLGGEKFPTMDTSAASPLLAHLQTVLKAGKDIADKAALIATGWSITVNPAMALVGRVLADSLDIIGKTLDIAVQLGGDKFPTFDTSASSPLMTRLTDVLKAGKDLADRATEVARNWSITVNPAMKTVGDALSDGLGIIQSVLEFNDLKSKLAAFRPLDMSVFGPKIDLIFQAAQDLASRFVAKAQAAGISKAMQDAASALAGVFGNAADSIQGALDMAAQLLDPETQIPSIGQIEGKLNAVLALIGEVVNRFAAKAASIGPDTAKSAEGLSNAVKSVFEAISQVIQAVKDAADLNLGTAGFNNIAALLTYLFDTFDQMAGRSAGLEQVVGAVTTLLGGIQSLVSTAGFTAGQSWAAQFAAGIAAGTSAAQGAALTASTTRTPHPFIGGGGGGGGGGPITVNNITQNNKTFNITVNNTTTDAGKTTWAGIAGITSGY